MTEVEPRRRPDLEEILSEISALHLVSDKDWARVDPDMFIEYILVSSGYEYEWDEGSLTGTVDTLRRINLRIV